MNRRIWKALENALSENVDTVAADDLPRRAAVMVLLTDEADPKLIFTLRAKHLNQHPGEVCFPGGKWELHDKSLLATALRETHEEIGLAPALIDVVGALPPRATRSGTIVHPFVGKIPAEQHFNVNHHELQALFSVPLDDFQKGLQIRTDIFQHAEKRLHIPAYRYRDYEIWGFTAGVTADLLRLLQSLSSKYERKM